MQGNKLNLELFEYEYHLSFLEGVDPLGAVKIFDPLGAVKIFERKRMDLILQFG